MKYLLVILLVLTLAGCANPLTRLLPKIEKLEVDPELMKPPQELKIIEKPTPTSAEPKQEKPNGNNL